MKHAEIESLPPVAEMMRDAGLEPKKSLGQNFLFDLNLTRKIARSVPDIEKSVVLEIGPGPGGLTRALLECGAKKVIAVEKDKSALPILEQIQSASGGRLEIIHADALKMENGKLKIENDKFAICSNLPYNIGTELLVKWLHEFSIFNFPFSITSMTLMFQREVAERIVAKPGNKQYGRLSVLASLGWHAKILFNVPNTAFSPPPKVQSAVVQLVPFAGEWADARSADGVVAKVEILTAKLFGRRRKMIRGIMPDVDWAEFGLSGAERAEELPPETFIKLAKKYNIAIPKK